jgi:hypothetical protein
MDAMLHFVGGPNEDWRLALVVSTFEWEAEPPLRAATSLIPTSEDATQLLPTVRALLAAIGEATLSATASSHCTQAARCTRPSELFAREYYLRLDPTAGLDPPATPTDGLRFWVRCVFLPSPLQVDVAAILCEAVLRAPNRACYVNLQHAGGVAAAAAALPARCEIAFSRRGWEWSAVVCGVHRRGDAQVVHEWVLSTVERLLRFAVGTYHVDLGPADGALAAHAFDPTRARRLCSLKRQYDPSHLLAHCLPLREIESSCARSSRAVELEVGLG